MESEIFKKGIAKRRKVLGDEYVDKALASADEAVDSALALLLMEARPVSVPSLLTSTPAVLETPSSVLALNVFPSAVRPWMPVLSCTEEFAISAVAVDVPPSTLLEAAAFVRETWPVTLATPPTSKPLSSAPCRSLTSAVAVESPLVVAAAALLSS